MSASQTAIYHIDNSKYMQNRYSEQVILKVLSADNTVVINNSNNIYTAAKRHFVICNSCFWCASLYYSDSMTIKCHTCNSYTNLESMPLSKNESFKFNYHSRTGIVLEFS